MARPLVYADFNNLADAPNRCRLTCAGTIRDLERQGLKLHEGLLLTLYTDDADDAGRTDNLLVDGAVQFSQAENAWVAAVDWNTLRHESDEPAWARDGSAGAKDDAPVTENQDD